MTKNPLNLITMSASSFSKGEQKIADFIIEFYDEISQLTIKQFSQKVKVSESSIIRFTQKLGYRGYSDFKIACATAAVTENRQHFHFEDIISKNKISSDEEILFTNVLKLYQLHTVKTIEKNFSEFDFNQLESIIPLFLEKDHIYFVGEGESGMVAYNAYYKLKTILRNVHIANEMYSIVSDSYLLQKNDLVVAVSQSGQTNDVLNFCKKAQEVGATVISFTTNLTSPLAKASDFPILPISLITDASSKYFINQSIFTLIFDSIYIYLQSKISEEKEDYLIPLFDHSWF